MNAISPRTPTRTTDPDGAPIVRVPLAKGRGVAVLDAEDFDSLATLGFSTKWVLNEDGHGRGYVRCNHPAREATGGLLSVARLVMEAPPGMVARYRDGDRTNLRRSNLYLEEGRGARGRELEVILQRRAMLAGG